MLRNEKCVNHFRDSPQGEEFEFVMMNGREQFSFHACRANSRLVVKFFVVQNKGLACCPSILAKSELYGEPTIHGPFDSRVFGQTQFHRDCM